MIELPVRVRATQFIRPMRSGYSSPCIFRCEDSRGSDAGEFVVKFGPNCKRGWDGLTAEVLSQGIAQRIGLPVARTAIVSLDLSVRPDRQLHPGPYQSITRSVGENFATELMVGGFRVWQGRQRVGPRDSSTAHATFLFDLLIENWDRRQDNPNLFLHNGRIVLLDHESAFTSVWNPPDNELDWAVANWHHIAKHLFYERIRKDHATGLDLMDVAEPLERLDEAFFALVRSAIPSSWLGGRYDAMQSLIASKVSNLETFVSSVRETLS